MTANGTAKTPSDFMAAILAWFQPFFRLMGRIALGGLALVVAGILATTMALVGLLIAMAALIFRMTRGRARRATYQARTPGGKARNAGLETGDSDGVILEARQTGHGWTVE